MNTIIDILDSAKAMYLSALENNLQNDENTPSGDLTHPGAWCEKILSWEARGRFAEAMGYGNNLHVGRYMLRYALAYAAEYYMIADCIISDILNNTPAGDRVSVNITSLGCGSNIDYWSFRKRMAAARMDNNRINFYSSYLGADMTNWPFRFDNNANVCYRENPDGDMPSVIDTRYFINHFGDFFSLLDANHDIATEDAHIIDAIRNSNIFIFPKSLSENELNDNDEDLRKIRSAFTSIAERLTKDTIYICISYENENYLNLENNSVVHWRPNYRQFYDDRDIPDVVEINEDNRLKKNKTYEILKTIKEAMCESGSFEISRSRMEEFNRDKHLSLNDCPIFAEYHSSGLRINDIPVPSDPENTLGGINAFGINYGLNWFSRNYSQNTRFIIKPNSHGLDDVTACNICESCRYEQPDRENTAQNQNLDEVETLDAGVRTYFRYNVNKDTNMHYAILKFTRID